MSDAQTLSEPPPSPRLISSNTQARFINHSVGSRELGSQLIGEIRYRVEGLLDVTELHLQGYDILALDVLISMSLEQLVWGLHCTDQAFHTYYALVS